MKTFNIIVFRPGFAGNFTKLLLSLDPSTHPHGPSDYNPPVSVDLNTRKNLYSFRSLQNINNFWHNHHLSVLTNIVAFFREDNPYQILNYASHPPEFYRDIEPFLKGLHQSCKINFISIVASARVDGLVEAFNRKNGSVLGDRAMMQEIECYHKFNSEYATIHVSLDEFFSTDEAFMKEYIRISTLLDIPLHCEHAIEFYHDWRRARQRNRIAPGNTKDEIKNDLAEVLTKLYDKLGIEPPEGIGNGIL